MTIDKYLGTTDQCLVFNIDNEPVKGTEKIKNIDPASKPIISQVTGNENYYRLFILDENAHPTSYILNATAQGWGEIGETKGEIEGAGTLINDSYTYGKHMAVVEDHIGENSVVYMTRYIAEADDEDCLGKTQIVAYTFNGDLAATPTETVLSELASGDLKGEGELQLSQDGTHLIYYNRTDNISGFSHKTIELRLLQLGGDRVTVIGSKTVARPYTEGEIGEDYTHYGTYGKSSADFQEGTNFLFSQRGIFEENASDEIAQNGNERQVYFYDVTTESVNYTTTAGEYHYNEIRRGKNKLHYVPTEAEANDLRELSTTEALPFPYTGLDVFPIEGGFKLISSLPTQPFKLIGDEEPKLYTRIIGAKQYEFNDHLGNVRAVVSDRRGLLDITETSPDVFEIENDPELVAWTDYYPFGARLRGANSSEYRFSFQGQEHDDEVRGEGNSINYKYRMHDPRVGRFFAVDPLAPKYPNNSVYAFSENRVIDGVEIEGLEVQPQNEKETWDLGESGVSASGIDEGTHEGATYDAGGTFKLGDVDGTTVRAFEITSGPNAGNYIGTAYNQDGTYEYNRYLISGASINKDSPFFSVSTTESSPTLDFVKYYNSLSPYLLYTTDPVGFSQSGAFGRNDWYELTTKTYANSTWGSDGTPGVSLSEVYETEYKGHSNGGNPLIFSLLLPGPKITKRGSTLVLGIDVVTMGNFAKMSGGSGVYRVLVHGAPEYLIIDGIKTSVEDVFGAMLKNGYKKGMPIELVSCWTGLNKGGVGQKLADLSGGVVKAPTNKIRVVGGTTYRISNDGVLKTFYPQ